MPVPDWLRKPLARWRTPVSRTTNPPGLDGRNEGTQGIPVGPISPVVLMDAAGRLYASGLAVGTTTPTVALPVEAWSANLDTRDPWVRLLGVLNLIPGVSQDAVNFNSNSFVAASASFAFAATAAAGGTLAATPFLASAGAGLKWKIEWCALQAVQAAASAGDVVISDSVGSIPIGGGGFLWNRKQATAATAIDISASGLAGSSTIRFCGQARAVA